MSNEDKPPPDSGLKKSFPNPDDPVPEGKTLICRPWITLRNGQRLYASQIGKKAICFYGDAR
jgi:hypothetical protein